MWQTGKQMFRFAFRKRSICGTVDDEEVLGFQFLAFLSVCVNFLVTIVLVFIDFRIFEFSEQAVWILTWKK